MRLWFYRILCIIGLAGLLVACSAPAAEEATEENAPQIAVIEQFEAALEARDVSAMLALIEPSETRYENSAELRLLMNSIEELRFAEMEYMLVMSDDTNATVQVQGTLFYTIGGEDPAEYAINTTVDMVNVDGDWYMQGFNPAEAVSPGGSTE